MTIISNILFFFLIFFFFWQPFEINLTWISVFQTDSISDTSLLLLLFLLIPRKQIYIAPSMNKNYLNLIVFIILTLKKKSENILR